jgi:large subunit ribosomal protein L30
MADRLRVTLRKSPISYTAQARGTVRALGLRRIGQTVEVPDTPVMRGMARAVSFLVTLEELSGNEDTRPAHRRRTAEEGTSRA